MLLTRRQSLRTLRNATGYSRKHCEALIEEMDWHKDGERWKVSDIQVNKALADAKRIEREPKRIVLSERKIARIQAI